MAVGAVLDITREFVVYWSRKYEELAKYEDQYCYLLEEVEKLPEPKFLNKDLFVKIARWKTPRQTSNYEANDEALVEEATRLSSEVSNDKLRLHVLQVLKGVNAPVASTLLHFLSPDRFAIFDVRARTTLAKAGQWGSPGDDSNEAWLQYTQILRDYSAGLDASLRDVEKALWAFDKWGP